MVAGAVVKGGSQTGVPLEACYWHSPSPQRGTSETPTHKQANKPNNMAHLHLRSRVGTHRVKSPARRRSGEGVHFLAGRRKI